MAEKLKKFEFKPNVGTTHAKHDWDKYLDGSPWRLIEGEDYSCKPQTISMMARKHAVKRGKTVKVQKVDGGLVIQAFDAE